MEKLNTDFFPQAARHAGWLPCDEHESPGASYAGYRTSSTELEKLVRVVDKDKNRQIAASLVEQGIPDIAHLFSIYYYKNHSTSFDKAI